MIKFRSIGIAIAMFCLNSNYSSQFLIPIYFQFTISQKAYIIFYLHSYNFINNYVNNVPAKAAIARANARRSPSFKQR